MSEEEAKQLLSSEITAGLDLQKCREMLDSMTKQERREFYIRRVMAHKGLTFRAIVNKYNRRARKKEHLTAWGLNLAVKRATWTARVVKCLERGLGVDLTVFLYKPGELAREKGL